MVYGIGEAKLAQFGDTLWATLDEFCQANGLSRDVEVPPDSTKRKAAVENTLDNTLDDDRSSPKVRRQSAEKARAFDLFREGKSLDDVVLTTGRAYTTVADYLAEFIREEQPASVSAWVSDEIYAQVAAAAENEGRQRLKPIFVALDERVAYPAIRIVLAHLAISLGDP